jgi:P4 family phage/plasmid primase-like protien
MQSPSLIPDFESAQRFLETLEPNGKFTFQTFDDDQDRRDNKLAKQFNGTLREHFDELSRFQEKGAGIFVTINRTDLKGRKAENVVDVRAIFVDLDGAPIEPVLRHNCEPHIIVESSQGRWHAYWRCALDKEDFTPTQKALINAFDGDKSVIDLPRVMRLPGFFHQKVKNNVKSAPFMTRLEQIEEDSSQYTAEELFSYFPKLNSGENKREGARRADYELLDAKTLAEVLKYLDPAEREEWIATAHALKALDEDYLSLFLDFSEGKFSAQKPKNYAGRDDVVKTWNSLKPVRTGFGALVARAKKRGYMASFSGSSFQTGSQIEVAKATIPLLKEQFGDAIFDEGRFWGYNKTNWQEIIPTEIRRIIHQFDGAKVKKASLKLSKAFIDGVINELAVMLNSNRFFENAAEGVNMLNGFVKISVDGTAELVQHHPDLRQKFCIQYSYKPRLTATHSGLLDTLFTGCFGAEFEEYGSLILQMYGASICGVGTRLKEPKAFILYGQSAANGKSTIQEVLRRILPHHAICSISPGDMDKEQYLAKLIGASANLSDELSNAAAISSDKFKAVITGDPVTAKVIYKEPVEFKPRAMHILSTNVLPSFKGGIDAGIERRLLVIPFKRTIPVEERITNFEKKLMREQGDNLISEAIREAALVLKNGCYSIPATCQEATMQWMKEADTVGSWLEDGGLRRAVPRHEATLLNEVYICFRQDMDEMGIKYIPGLLKFNSKVREFIANDPSWEEVRHADGKKIKRSNLVTRMTGNS